MSYLDTIKARRKNKKQATLHQQTAEDIAKEFNDLDHIGLYMKLCKLYPHHTIIQTLEKVRASKNPRNKGALFTHLLLKK